jgi:hypothetical protein
MQVWAMDNLLAQHNPCLKRKRLYRSRNLGDKLLARGSRHGRRESARRRLHGYVRELGRGAV